MDQDEIQAIWFSMDRRQRGWLQLPRALMIGHTDFDGAVVPPYEV
jgi:hypothetical protein